MHVVQGIQTPFDSRNNYILRNPGQLLTLLCVCRSSRDNTLTSIRFAIQSSLAFNCRVGLANSVNAAADKCIIIVFLDTTPTPEHCKFGMEEWLNRSWW